MFNDFSADVLGSEYRVYFVDKFPERLSEFEDDSDGLFNQHNQEIFIKRCRNKDMTEEGKERCEKTTLRHELIHAYLSESGLSANASHCYTSWAENEEMVDWFAIQAPKIFKTFQEVGCI